MSISKAPDLVVRKAKFSDVADIVTLMNSIYGPDFLYVPAMIRAQIRHFPDGIFVCIYQDRLVGYCSTFRISEKVALTTHTWDEITGGGYSARHDPTGDFLYGMDVAVAPDCRKMRIGQRLYDERKKLCMFLRLNGIAFGGRMSGLSRRGKRMTPATYAEGVTNRKIKDTVLSFQIRNGFEIIGVLPKYFPTDTESRGYAALLVWRNPRMVEIPKPATTDRGRLPLSMRIGAIQYQQRRIASFEEFGTQVEYFVDVVASYRGDFAVFPELFTLQLLSIDNKPLSPQEAIASLSSYEERFKELMSGLAVRHNVNIIGGSIPSKAEDGTIRNVCYVFLRDGSIHSQAKIQPTPNERDWWNLTGGTQLDAIQTDCGPIGVLICYDSEFPELARHLVDQGAQTLFVPFCTDERQSYLRVRYCCQARAVENQAYVIMAGNVGNLPSVRNMDIQYAQSCILTPCDFPFARDGIAADTTPNVEMVAFADLRPDALALARNAGTVQNLKDRRFDLYSVTWRRRG
ncbi:carbon-nitrogen hydrolase family protein [Magnetospirillum sp. SS-4]|uniref:carbon-nitrogen hydrolase family protein n=1 Tax=Magnetospirillum sp. SS-4 TaxID=2681465 RepID=UPI0013865822|nr:bifunctional GNAT family N-acetyltransferase/carbon-nitrogen hydrolase family protein [Magnetospirillum sp. SS-4]CAA7612295.1 Hydrolase YhcX [Magnetospirillum sp. SS-4]